MLPLQCRLTANLLFGCVKLIGYIDSAINMISFNPYVGPSPRIKISFALLSIFTGVLVSAPKIRTFFPKLLSVNKSLNEN